MNKAEDQVSRDRHSIVRISITKFDVALRHPLAVSVGIIDAARNVLIQIETESGLIGWGEASPFAPITGDSQESNFAMGRVMGRALLGRSALAIEDCMKAVERNTIGEPSLRSAFDMALHDIAAKAAGLPLYRFLGGERREIRTDLTIGIQASIEDTVSRAQQILDLGFDAIKLKVGRIGLEDAAHVRAVRELVGPDIAIKIDSNQGWDLPTAIANIEAMADLDLQYSEQPLPYWDIEGLAQLRRKVSLPVCADESLFDHHDALNLVRREAADFLNIKLAKAGGIRTALKINAIAEAAGLKCMIGCFSESRLGLSASAHLAMARSNIQHIDLDSAYDFKVDPVIGGMAYDDNIGGLIRVDEEPGLGAAIDPDFLLGAESYEIERQ